MFSLHNVSFEFERDIDVTVNHVVENCVQDRRKDLQPAVVGSTSKSVASIYGRSAIAVTPCDNDEVIHR
jgi:hypothetical protein